MYKFLSARTADDLTTQVENFAKEHVIVDVDFRLGGVSATVYAVMVTYRNKTRDGWTTSRGPMS